MAKTKFKKLTSAKEANDIVTVLVKAHFKRTEKELKKYDPAIRSFLFARVSSSIFNHTFRPMMAFADESLEKIKNQMEAK